jgi:NTP pyrophosphatase (non-canonical NTP hydrolase)
MPSSDKSTTIDEVKQLVKAFCDERKWDPYHSPKDLAIGLVTESSELLELFRFVLEKDMPNLMKDPAARANMADELADSLYFILRFAQMYDFDLAQALRQKMKKNAEKYPAP